MKKHWIILSIVAAIMAGAISLSFVLSRPQGDTLYAAISVAADSLTEQGMASAAPHQLQFPHVRLDLQHLPDLFLRDPVFAPEGEGGVRCRHPLFGQ